MLRYRPDIDGLRALAVVPVILFHSSVQGFSGGYVGVDIFFVISGFLITSIIYAEMEKGEFSILTFYERRVRRIFPALFTVIALTLLAGYLILLPNEYENLGKNALSATLFSSNLYLMTEIGYFAAPAETNALLHTWSLAVEEQFYIFFPPFLMAICSLGRRKILTLLAAISLCSLVLSVYLTKSHPESSFFFTPIRIWELMIGAILVFIPRANFSRLIANALSLTGFSLIAFSIFAYTPATPFPGYAALAPCIGTALIIYAGQYKDVYVSNLLSLSPINFIGKLSYSLYLFHWPVIVFLKLYVMTPITHFHFGIYFITTFALSYLNWKYIETPFRKKTILGNRKNILISSVMTLCLFSAISFITIASQGLPFRINENISFIAEAANDKPNLSECLKDEKAFGPYSHQCSLGGDNNKQTSVLMWGDSHGEALMPALDKALTKLSLKGEFVGRGGCIPLLDAYQAAEGFSECPQINDAIFNYISEMPHLKTVILASRWSLYANGLRYEHEHGSPVYLRTSDTIQTSLELNKVIFKESFLKTLSQLKELGLTVYVVEQVPEVGFDVPEHMARSKLLNQNVNIEPNVNEYNERQKLVREIFKEAEDSNLARLISVQSVFCSETNCAIAKDEKPIYRDGNHITRTMSEEIAHIFIQPLSILERIN
ncbi:predicted acyltransferase [Hahella chejuensis KCTC 2396]|uniref:Predicted acyltransferase n=1 Tax=Hahella chejuensis (strain KCTC 2396) TaxID=349521 RepID=Q2SIK7_HAHCH|nr:acyltransferase family protein [Hahella chejuensis]ABC29517.1 predicted acyltransferase [Hahella chejuensis KCTC 2396]